LCTRGGT